MRRQDPAGRKDTMTPATAPASSVIKPIVISASMVVPSARVGVDDDRLPAVPERLVATARWKPTTWQVGRRWER